MLVAPQGICAPVTHDALYIATACTPLILGILLCGAVGRTSFLFTMMPDIHRMPEFMGCESVDNRERGFGGIFGSEIVQV